jgi:hypothetical protein
MAGPEPTPHPLIQALAKGLLTPPDQDALAAAKSAAEKPDVSVFTVTQFATRSDVPEVVALDGYFGGKVNEGGAYWWVLYQAIDASEWLLIRRSDMVFWECVKHKPAPFGEYNRVWVRKDARVVEGTGHQTPQSRYLNGDFTSAADLKPAVDEGTYGSPTGPYCACTKRSYA